MKARYLFLIVVPVRVIVTVLLYQPASLAIYRLREPDFAPPLKSASGKLYIRNDAMGQGAFGTKRSGGRTHSGIDIQAPVGTPVYASKSGIAFCGNVPTGYGKFVLIYQPDGMQTMYGHLSNWNVSTGKKIHRGDIIGFVGKTGNAASKSMQPHLHFEIRNDGDVQDPQDLLK